MRAIAGTLLLILSRAVAQTPAASLQFEVASIKASPPPTMSWVADNSPDAPAPNIFQAVQEQLGLKLESKKVTGDVLVVDHIEKSPTEN
jgi:hypothetical protein